MPGPAACTTPARSREERAPSRAPLPPMTVCQLTNSPVSGSTPVSGAVATHAAALASLGHDVLVLSPCPDPPGLPRPAPAFVGTRFHRGGSPLALPPRPELFHAHHAFLSGAEALRLAHRHAAPLVFSAGAEYQSPLDLADEEAADLRRFIGTLGICYANRCDLVLASSAAAAERLRAEGVVRPLRILAASRPGASARDHALGLHELYREASQLHHRECRVGDTTRGRRLLQELSLDWARVRRHHRRASAASRVAKPGGDENSPC